MTEVLSQKEIDQLLDVINADDKFQPSALSQEELRELLGYNNALRFIPEKHRTAKLCLEAVKSNGYALQYVPEKHKTAELCLAAVKSNGNALQYVPEEYKTAELYLEAVKTKVR